MNPLFLGAIIASFLKRKRRCPKCKRDQIIPPSKRLESVRCKFCGTDIPPHKGL